jgi:flagellar protein FliO/FliZ
MSILKTLCWIALWWMPVCLAEVGADISKPVARAAASGNIANWSLGLIIVLCVFFLCVWGVRKLGGLTVNGAQQMRIIGGLSLGMREKIMLVQVGEKQLILGVTPGRIQTLHVLENDECLLKASAIDAGGGFGEKLMQAMKGKSDVQ